MFFRRGRGARMSILLHEQAGRRIIEGRRYAVSENQAQKCAIRVIASSRKSILRGNHGYGAPLYHVQKVLIPPILDLDYPTIGRGIRRQWEGFGCGRNQRKQPGALNPPQSRDGAMDKIILALSIAGAVCLMTSMTACAQPAWSIVESKSPTDDSPQVSAGLVVGDAALILRCKEQKTEAAFSTKDTYLGDKPVTIRFRINSQEPIKEIWRPSMNGRAAFAPKPEDFIRALPDNGRVFIRALTAAGETKDTNFILSGVSEIREKIGRACNWSSTPDETTGSISPSQKR